MLFGSINYCHDFIDFLIYFFYVFLVVLKGGLFLCSQTVVSKDGCMLLADVFMFENGEWLLDW